MLKLMRYIAALLFLACFSHTIAQELPYGFPKTERSRKEINQGWRFLLGDPNETYYETEFDDSSWELVNVPHTLALTSLTLDGLQDDKAQLIFHRDVGWYRKDITVEESERKVFLEFEGSHQVTNLWVNGKHVGEHSVGGYTPFHFDITKYVNKGETNQITILTDNRRSQVVPPDPGPFDYVKFSGLYRDVYLVETPKLHVTFNWESSNSGVYITTPTIDPVNKNATIHVKTAVRNDSSHNMDCRLSTRIIDQEGIVVLKLEQEATVAPNEEYQFDQIGSLEDNVQFWGIDNPYLYRVNSVLLVDGEEVDYVENRIGLRKFELDPVQGFLLNNKPIKLIGFNRHQQYPYVGDAVPNSLHYKDMLQFKEFGFNVMRTAHYPQDNALLEACDELGILAYEEAPTWIGMPNESLWWENLESATRAMIRNHRNHPSIVIWGAGINHRGYVPRMHNTVKQEDPVRLTASQGSRWTGWQTSGLTDINANMLYGPFIWDRSEPMFAMEGRRGPAELAPYKRDQLMVGLISWTAHAYYTFHPRHEKAQNPIDRTRAGMMTIFRYPRPKHQWYKSELVEEPFLFIQEEWQESTNEVSVFSNADHVELFVNDKSIGKHGPSQDTAYVGLDHPPFHFKNISYEKGKIVAKAYFKDGSILEQEKKTPGKPVGIRLTADTKGRAFIADGSDIMMVYASIIDKNGTVISGTDHKVSFSVSGDAKVIGDGKGINANPMFTEYGVAPALIRSGNSIGEITITAKSRGLKSAQVRVSLTAYEDDIVLKKAKPIYDFKRIRVDLGADDQLVQFGWEYWNGKDEGQNEFTLKNFNNATVNVNPASSEGILRWLGEMNVIGKYGFAYGDGVIGIDEKGVNLKFNGLPEGDYMLKTWHHAPQSNSDSMDPNKEKLKTMTIPKLPYELSLSIQSNSTIEDEPIAVKVTEGKEMQWDLPGTSQVKFRSNGKDPVIINFNGSEGKGIWINAFELSESR